MKVKIGKHEVKSVFLNYLEAMGWRVKPCYFDGANVFQVTPVFDVRKFYLNFTDTTVYVKIISEGEMKWVYAQSTDDIVLAMLDVVDVISNYVD